MITKPMLAARCTDVNKIKFPVLATPKIDGIRCLRINGQSVSRTFKDIPNRHTQERMKDLPDGLDGELVVGKTFQETTSGVMSRDGEPDFRYWVFDWVPIDLKIDWLEYGYWVRMNRLDQLELPDFCEKLIPVELHNLSNLQQYEKMCLGNGHEGIMIRQPDSPYKCGRSTEREGYLIKIKRFKDSEAIVVDFVEQMRNTNEVKICDCINPNCGCPNPNYNKLGYRQRSTHQAGMIGKNTLGKFVVKEIGETPWKGQIFHIGTGIGLTKKRRQEIWFDQKLYLGQTITYKYQEIGTKNLPRCPIFKGFRKDA